MHTSRAWRDVRVWFWASWLFPHVAFAGAWTQPEGKGMLALSSTYYNSDEFYDDVGNLRSQSHYQKHEVSAYGEWGASDSITLGANLFANHVEQQGKHNYTLSNSEFFSRLRLYKDNERVISMQPLLKLPSYAYRGRTPQSGSETYDAEIAALYGESVHILSDRDFIDATIALRTRSHGRSSLWRTETKYGVGIAEQWLLIAGLYTTHSFSIDTPTTFREGGDYDYDLTKAEVNLLYSPANNRYWQVSYFSHIDGIQAGAGDGLSLTYGMRF